MKGTVNNFGNTYEYNLSEHDKDKIVMLLLEYFGKTTVHEEGIYQNDSAMIEAPEYMTSICEVFDFKEVGDELPF